MQVVERVTGLRALLSDWRRQAAKIALVPTMGNLHQGHLSLVDEARRRGDRVVATIFVNPLQFDRADEVARYPRTLDEDLRLLRERGTDLVFAPPLQEVYPRPLEAMTRVELPGLTEILCGAHRPGHFTGVTTVVAKLFNLTGPDVAVFGEKDYQQLRVIQRMVADLDFPIEIIGVPTVREASGLALSSRNHYLTPAERAQAPLLYRTLHDTAQRLRAGETDHAGLTAAVLARLEAGGLRPEYFEIRTETLAEPAGHSPDELVVLAAAWLGRARLIDNLPLARFEASPEPG
ncbi:MAG: pantoate--beta-alanine ligase [Candidatus Competibacterales bacterium]|nr:pantoate--beta-alanine ligase [Candidatus Competibacterales bacterium]